MYGDNKRFSELQIKSIESKHFTYHLNKLVELGFIEKKDGKYTLTTNGKMYLGRIDEANMKIEKLPKVGVVVFPMRKNDSDDTEILLSKRLKHPNYGKIVGLGGKVRFGKRFEDTAERELFEETGLHGNLKFKGILRKIGYVNQKDASKVVLDIVFAIFTAESLVSNLITQISDQENFWIKKQSISKLKNASETLPAFIKVALRKTIQTPELISEMNEF